MKISTGIILSVLSTNVFAIEHLNGAHPSSLLARRAMVADADGPSLQKRNNDGDKEKQEEQTKSKISVPNPDQKKFVYRKDFSKDDPYSNLSSNDGTGEGPTYFRVYDSSRDDEDKNGREDAYTGLVPNQGRLSFADALRDSPFHALGHIKNRLFRKKLGLELFFSSKDQISAVSKAVTSQLGGEKGEAIGKELYTMLEYALKISKSYQTLYRSHIQSPFDLELPFAISDRAKENYRRLQYDVLEYIRAHILAVRACIELIIAVPKNVILELKKILSSADNFYKAVLNAKSRYSDLLGKLEIFDDSHLEDLDKHIESIEVYKYMLSDYFSKIKKKIQDHRKNPNERARSKSSSSTLEPKGRPEVESKPSKDGASGSAQSKSEVLGGCTIKRCRCS
ncbi:hypothetical protein BASA81_004723 [Batrachochytrium salamandrivorans]|nr:hypothetical protein BASA81_004723 [Batrachochytrium salamandrivorans]